MASVLTNLFDGVAYGMLLFVLACGLAVTLGLMNFANLAHGAFAMAGGYICAVLVNKAGWPLENTDAVLCEVLILPPVIVPAPRSAIGTLAMSSLTSCAGTEV